MNGGCFLYLAPDHCRDAGAARTDERMCGMESESGGHQIVARQPDLGVSFLHPADCRGRLQCHEQMVNGGGKLESVTEI